MVDIEGLENLVNAIKDVQGIGAFKIGFSLLTYGLQRVTDTIKATMGKPIPVIYDHQKAGNDIPRMGRQFARMIKNSGIDAVILFPFAGPVSQENWILSCREHSIEVIVGSVMTHEKFLASEGGYIDDSAAQRIFRLSCHLGVRHFVVPSTKLDWVRTLYELLLKGLKEEDFTLYTPGFIEQKGEIEAFGQIVKSKWHVIVGSAIYEKHSIEDMKQAAIEIVAKINSVK